MLIGLLALMLRDFRFNTTIGCHGDTVKVRAALWEQCTETEHSSLIHGLLCTCTSTQRSKIMFTRFAASVTKQT
jgi:hypothetical protein